MQELSLPKRELSNDDVHGIGLTDILEKLDKSQASHLLNENLTS
jgi:hypothetical protein